jgi:hypothetical protein
VFEVDVRLLIEQLTPADHLPGVALLVAREIVESAVLDGAVDEEAAGNLMQAAMHLRVAANGRDFLRSYPTLIGQLIHMAEGRSLPDSKTLADVRSALRQLVQAVPPEGSALVTAEYVGF